MDGFDTGVHDVFIISYQNLLFLTIRTIVTYPNQVAFV